MTRAAVTLDVDSLRFYREIHGIARATDDLRDPIYEIAMPRFWDLIEEARFPATLFLIGADAPHYAGAFAPVSATGSEVASHSFAHDYRLTRLSVEQIELDVSRAHAALQPLAGGAPIVGFRSPGYNTSEAVLRSLASLGYRYDSSLLPSPLYFAARGAAIGAHALAGHPSRSLIGEARAFAGPLEPYRVDLERPWRRCEDSPIWELPIACEPWTRAPLIGTSWVLSPEPVRRRILKSALQRLSVLNFEMHAIDLLDATDPGIDVEGNGALASLQRDLRLPTSRKIAAFRALFRTLADHTEVKTLRSFSKDLEATAQTGKNQHF